MKVQILKGFFLAPRHLLFAGHFCFMHHSLLLFKLFGHSLKTAPAVLKFILCQYAP